jgi:RNA polymerase sigma-70 factor (ECF subfamily)
MIDIQTINRFKDGDSQAFGDIYIEFWDRLIKVLQKYDEVKVEDIVSDTFIQLWNKKTLIQPDKNLFNYICTIARNIINDQHDHNTVEQNYSLSTVKQSDMEQTSYSPEDEMIAKDLKQKINLVVAKMTKQQQQIFYLNRTEGLSYKEIAQKLVIKVNTVKSHIHHINKILYKYLDSL